MERYARCVIDCQEKHCFREKSRLANIQTLVTGPFIVTCLVGGVEVDAGVPTAHVSRVSGAVATHQVALQIGSNHTLDSRRLLVVVVAGSCLLGLVVIVTGWRLLGLVVAGAVARQLLARLTRLVTFPALLHEIKQMERSGLVPARQETLAFHDLQTMRVQSGGAQWLSAPLLKESSAPDAESERLCAHESYPMSDCTRMRSCVLAALFMLSMPSIGAQA